ncbi:hypothetical protein CHGG_04499 [Chaetomium globosum CBS 148.51]|uniref:EamA domain-containing protein n=1 Tax=Chaetomium globosum (strain ATCC 6205 / CBS 148.51 / DSM 1962 / NBRC 6347 / NRRL 1970) TaxID=306901 RepID=Q2H147_CHAGB|nr:uncharacterized protein CHGG_04499 [Chaetomium globosum CBS 148.51]EAQ87880.1 hypothetical protein CHGG_04499 [Chaetomium globosum CBS 148.51]
MPTLRPRKRHPEAPAVSAPISTTPDLKKKVTSTTKAKNEKRLVDDMNSSATDEGRPFLDGDNDGAAAGHSTGVEAPLPESRSWAQRNQWIVYALASGACAAFNGVFAKLTTTELTTTFSLGIARMLGLESIESAIEVIVRGSFFGLNLVFNGVMWTLFTTALARGNSTTQVSIMNTSANFVITAVFGFIIFSESLSPLWWLGAAMLVAGNVIIGRKDEGSPKDGEEVEGDGSVALGSGDESEMGALRHRSGGPFESGDDEAYKDEDVADLRI